MSQYGYRDALRESWRADPLGFVLGLLAVPPVVFGLYVLLVIVLVVGQP